MLRIDSNNTLQVDIVVDFQKFVGAVNFYEKETNLTYYSFVSTSRIPTKLSNIIHAILLKHIVLLERCAVWSFLYPAVSADHVALI